MPLILVNDDLLETNLVSGNAILKNTKQEKVLGVKLDNFATYSLNINEKANKKFNALTQVRKYMSTVQKNIFSSFIKSPCTYCPLIWMFLDALNFF